MRKALEQKYTNSTLDNLASGERFLREEEYKSEIDTDKDADADTSAELLEEAGSRRPDGVNAIDADSHGQRQPDEERDQHTGTAATGAHIAGRTCSKIRKAPYRGTESEDTPIDVKTSGHASYLMARHSAPGKAVKASPEPEKKVAVASEPKNPVRMVPELEEKVRAALELVEEVKGGPTDATTLRKNKRTDPDSCAGENRMNLKNSNASSDEEDEEPKIYVFAGRGRRGVDSLVSKQSRLTRIGPTKTVVWNVWEIDLTENDLSAYRSISETTSNSGAKAESARSATKKTAAVVVIPETKMDRKEQLRRTRRRTSNISPVTQRRTKTRIEDDSYRKGKRETAVSEDQAGRRQEQQQRDRLKPTELTRLLG
ncbi:hypothetical protein V7S43_018648 [Phytophthora oleae]|uniref:Uncharacterized protein n=1 Tax=Phytophthora oleae TaxID=2107226 RepID=A0ABD3ETB9_9STRA